MLDIEKHFKGEGYLFQVIDEDTVNLICRRGHIYADGDHLVASIYHAETWESAKLRQLGRVVMDGDDGELSVKFIPKNFRAVSRVMKPRYAISAVAL